MVDSNNRELITEARDELKQLLNETELRNVPVLVYANKIVSGYSNSYAIKSRNQATPYCNRLKHVSVINEIHAIYSSQNSNRLFCLFKIVKYFKDNYIIKGDIHLYRYDLFGYSY